MSDAQREILESLAKSQTAAHREVTRAKALLLAADGLASTAVAYEVGVSPSSVVAWRSRFAEEGLAKLGRVRPGRGRKPQIPAEKIDEIVRLTQESKPEGETHWSCRSMAKAAGVSPATVQRVWSARGLKPHLVRSFKVSNDPDFADKVEDIVGLYLDPPEKALVLSVDEKSQIQALDRTQPGLPLKKGRAGTMTHDYKRNGTATLFAALDIATGAIIGECLPRHRAKEFLAFLKKIDRVTPAELDLHLIVDNYATHKTPAVQRWLARHKRFTLHFTPTSSSWINLVERMFAEITRQRIRRGTFNNVEELKSAIIDWIENRNQNPKPFKWTANANSILAKHRRAKKALAFVNAGCE